MSARPTAFRLAAAVMVGASLITTAPAASAVDPTASPAGPAVVVAPSWKPADVPWTPEHGVPFGLLTAWYWDAEADDLPIHLAVVAGYAPGDVTLTARPAGAAASVDVVVPVSWTPGSNHGEASYAQIAELLGDVPVELRLLVKGDEVSRMDLSAFSDVRAHPPVEAGPQPVDTVHPYERGSYTFELWPNHQEVRRGTGGVDQAPYAVFIASLGTGEGRTVTLKDAPAHGRVWLGADGTLEYEPQSATDEDTFTVAVAQGGTTKTLTFTMVTETWPPEGDGPWTADTWLPSAGQPAGVSDAPVLLTAAPSGGSASAQPSAPTGSVTPSAPADSGKPSESAESSKPSTAAEPDHAVPVKVETGNGAAWWLAGIAAVGLAALVRFRRAFGLA